MIHYLQDNGRMGATGARLISGHWDVHSEVESFISTLYYNRSCLIFGSGYLANLGVLTALGSLQEKVEFFSDEFNHASIIDGIRLTKKKITIFRHNDLNHLEDLLQNTSAKIVKIIVTESVFSMDGDSPDLKLLAALASQYGAYLVIDEAHATGVCGEQGLGLAQGISLDESNVFLIHTSSKALGGYGAYVLTSSINRKFLINTARSFIYSTALSPVHTLQIQWALEELISHPHYLESLKVNMRMFSQNHPIMTIRVSGNAAAESVAAFLRRHHYFVRAIRYPTVKKGQERIRITIKSFYDQSIYLNFKNLLEQALAEEKLSL